MEDDDDDTGAMWRAHKAYRKEKRHANKDASTRMLTQRGIKFVSKNEGVHLIVQAGDKTVDFWPTTGLWICRSPKIERRGVMKLITFVAQQTD